jgi:carboxymethylenebutenolidase
MKKTLVLGSALLLALTGLAQDMTQCHTSPIDKFAMFASNKDFNKSHLTPRVYTHVSDEGGKMMKFKTQDGPEANGYVIENPKKTNNWVFVFQ